MRCNQVFYILSSEVSGLGTISSLERSNSLEKNLKDMGLSVTRGIGTYNGIEETSFLVVGQYSDSDRIVNLADYFGQVCIMRVYSDNHAELVYCNAEKTVKPLGKLKLVDNVDKTQDYSSFNGKHFQIVKE